MNDELGFEITITKPYELALQDVIEALKTQGFGVLTRIDVQATLKEKLNEEFRPYSILGACNPPLAHRALSSDPAVGLMLPFNVTVEALDDNSALVRIANPEVMMQAGNLGENQEIKAVAREARIKLLNVVQALNE